MTYASYLGSPTVTATEARVGSSPQSFMMYDIAALQALYGANFSKPARPRVYRWDAVTGQETINGVVAPNTGATATNKIFSTVWTQGARAHLRPEQLRARTRSPTCGRATGELSQAQLADLNSDADAGTPPSSPGQRLQRPALQGRPHSAVANMTTGSGNDTLIGNAATT